MDETTFCLWGSVGIPPNPEEMVKPIMVEHEWQAFPGGGGSNKSAAWIHVHLGSLMYCRCRVSALLGC